MARLDQTTPGAQVRGIHPGQVLTALAASPLCQVHDALSPISEALRDGGKIVAEGSARLGVAPLFISSAPRRSRSGLRVPFYLTKFSTIPTLPIRKCKRQ